MKKGINEMGEARPAYYRHLLPKQGEPVVAMLRERLRLLNPNHIRP